ETVLAKANARLPSDRFSNARAFADAFGTALSPPEPAIDQSRLDAHEVAELPFFRWKPIPGSEQQNARSTTYRSSEGGETCIVKIWPSVRRGQSRAIDLAMLAMFEGVARLRASPIAGLPCFDA